MRFYAVKTPRFLPLLQPKGLIWTGKTASSGIGQYLTFDDGPHPQVTPQVLAMLRNYEAKATFFCVGENAAAFPELVAQILAEGHTLGNHTHNHLNGWKTPTPAYVDNTLKAAATLATGWFRPPYGRIRAAQAHALQQQGFRIVMWDVLSCDFDARYGPRDCARFVIRNARSGSIVVFHDSLKAAPRCLPALELVLRYYHRRQLPFLALPHFRNSIPEPVS
ncbi:MAG: polysaccharide deacetylase family protein [Sphingobacteriales bacterium]|nr:MAG: polysaccharide deacetylase family protein [Sphingobacteriales bacterium]